MQFLSIDPLFNFICSLIHPTFRCSTDCIPKRANERVPVLRRDLQGHQAGRHQRHRAVDARQTEHPVHTQSGEPAHLGRQLPGNVQHPRSAHAAQSARASQLNGNFMIFTHIYQK